MISKTEYLHFKNWLDLDINSIAWEGRYSDSFSQFWDSFFKTELSTHELKERFEYAKKIAKSGPLISWLSWLFDKYLIYMFVFKDVSLRELAFLFDMKEREVSITLRDHLVKVYPQFEDLINDKFQVSNVSSENLYLKFSELLPELGDAAKNRGTFEDDILAQMEVTLYPDWPSLVKELKKDVLALKIDFDTFQKKLKFKKQVKLMQELIVLLLILSIIVVAVKNANRWYENYLSNKITLFEPNFFWLDKSLSYLDQELLAKQQIDLSNKELEELERIEAQQNFTEERIDSRYEPESDVVILDSIKDVPKTLAQTFGQGSEYEEKNKGGYKDQSAVAGDKKAYRLLMASVNPDEIKTKILPLLAKFDINQVDKVKPGTKIPGGIYFNLKVPSEHLKEFMAKVSTYASVTIYESRTRSEYPGRNRVFIWIKSI